MLGLQLERPLQDPRVVHLIDRLRGRLALGLEEEQEVAVHDLHPQHQESPPHQQLLFDTHPVTVPPRAATHLAILVGIRSLHPALDLMWRELQGLQHVAYEALCHDHAVRYGPVVDGLQRQKRVTRCQP